MWTPSLVSIPHQAKWMSQMRQRLRWRGCCSVRSCWTATKIKFSDKLNHVASWKEKMSCPLALSPFWQKGSKFIRLLLFKKPMKTIFHALFGNKYADLRRASMSLWLLRLQKTVMEPKTRWIIWHSKSITFLDFTLTYSHDAWKEMENLNCLHTSTYKSILDCCQSAW